MFDHQRGVTHVAALFFVFMLLLGTVSMMKMFMMLFINNLLHSENIRNLFKLQNFFFQCVEIIREKARLIANRSKKIERVNSNNEINISPKNKDIVPINRNIPSKNEIQLITKKGQRRETNDNSTSGIMPLSQVGANTANGNTNQGNIVNIIRENTNPQIGGKTESSKDDKELMSNPKLPSANNIHIPMKMSIMGLPIKSPSGKIINMKDSSGYLTKSPNGSPLKGSLKKKEFLKMQITQYKNKIVELEGITLKFFEE